MLFRISALNRKIIIMKGRKLSQFSPLSFWLYSLFFPLYKFQQNFIIFTKNTAYSLNYQIFAAHSVLFKKKKNFFDVCEISVLQLKASIISHSFILDLSNFLYSSISVNITTEKNKFPITNVTWNDRLCYCQIPVLFRGNRWISWRDFFVVVAITMDLFS